MILPVSTVISSLMESFCYTKRFRSSVCTLTCSIRSHTTWPLYLPCYCMCMLSVTLFFFNSQIFQQYLSTYFWPRSISLPVCLPPLSSPCSCALLLPCPCLPALTNGYRVPQSTLECHTHAHTKEFCRGKGWEEGVGAGVWWWWGVVFPTCWIACIMCSE